MRFSFFLMGEELFSFEFAAPSRGIYPVPDAIPSEWDLIELDYDSEEDD